MLLHKLTTQYLRNQPLEAARTLESRAPVQIAVLFSQLDPDAAAAAARYISTPQLVAAIDHMDPQDAVRLFFVLPLDMQLALWRSAQPALQDVLSEELPAKQLKLITRLSRFPPRSAGSLMDPLVFTVPHDLNVREALKLANYRPDALRFYVYVVDREQHLVGVLTLRQMIKAPPDVLTGALMEKRISKIHATASRSDVLEHPDWEHFHSLPVVDDDEILIGVIRYETWRREMTRNLGKDNDPIWDTLLALGELYWSGLSVALLGGAVTDPGPTKHQEKRDGE